MKKNIEINIYAQTDDSASERRRQKRLSTAYIAYIVAGRYFRSYEAISSIKEENLYLYYCELQPEKQKAEEEKLEHMFERKCASLLPLFKDLRCEVMITERESSAVLHFLTGFEELTVTVSAKGKVEFQPCLLGGIR
ncbi:MAG: hypothetical protein IJW67_02225 [Blautia sp.]|nr:hypothetical protein [Blautia sp.]